MTIEERANKLTDFSLHNGIKGTVRHTYIYAATEQRKIDIDKACQYLRDHIDPKLVIYNNESWTSLDTFIEDFRKAIEE